MATIQGVYSASVLDNRDPEGLARNKGTLFLPEVGDEVLVAFERGDLRAPCVIGSLWNGKARPPATSDPGGTKVIRSRTGVTLRIHDASDNSSSLVIETAGGQRITLQDGPSSVRVEDGNGNSITLAASGITINASAKVVVNASTVDLNAGMVAVNAGMARFSGVVQCDTLISNSVVSASYTPGAGNIW